MIIGHLEKEDDPLVSSFKLLTNTETIRDLVYALN